ncbi:MAG: DUF1513 domain-containing protein [Pseudomonadota bacterium]
MPDRRRFLAGAIAASFTPAPTWAEAGSPRYVSAARKEDGSYALFGLTEHVQIAFEVPLPGRGHAAAAHPRRPEAVMFARRPGTYAIVIDCVSGAPLARLAAPSRRHFYGHGAFSGDGSLLFTTENEYEQAIGLVGIWDTTRGYARIGEFRSGGLGPHDIRALSDGATLVVANGGIETHPASGRAKLNLPTMRPNLTILDLDGDVLSMTELDPALRQNSIRHLATGPDGAVAFAMQWQGDAFDHPPLIGIRKPDETVTLLEADLVSHQRMQGYAGSIAMDHFGRVAVTSPRGGRCQVFDGSTGQTLSNVALPDVCGVALSEAGFAVTTGHGLVSMNVGMPEDRGAYFDVQWDNHLVDIHGG